MERIATISDHNNGARPATRVPESVSVGKGFRVASSLRPVVALMFNWRSRNRYTSGRNNRSGFSEKLCNKLIFAATVRRPAHGVFGMDGLSTKQTEVLTFIRNYAAERGYPPTLSEIATAMGWASKARAAQMVNRLIRMGRLKKLPGQARTLTIVEPS